MTKQSQVFTHLYMNDSPTAECYTLSLHDALPIFEAAQFFSRDREIPARTAQSSEKSRTGIDAEDQRKSFASKVRRRRRGRRSEEHTSELQSLTNIVCRLLLEKKK